MWLLCRLQPPDVFDYNSTVVNFEHVTIPTAGISVGIKNGNKDCHSFYTTIILLECCGEKNAVVGSLTMLNHQDMG